MNKKITPDYVLNMLQELKLLADEKRFLSLQFIKKYPTYGVFRKYLFSKGLIKKEYNSIKWISIEPNIIMAKELLKLYITYTKEVNERYKNKTKNKKIEVLEQLESKIKSNQKFTRKRTPNKNKRQKKSPMALAKEIRQKGENWYSAVKRASIIMKGGKTKEITLREPTMDENYPISYMQKYKKEIADLKEHIEAKNEEIEFLHNSYTEKIEKIKKEYNIYNSNERIANESYKKRILEVENKMLENVEIYKNKLENLSFKIREEFIKDLKSKDELIENLQNQIDLLYVEGAYKKDNEIVDIPEPIYPKPQEKNDTLKGSRTYKLLGIPVFSITNK